MTLIAPWLALAADWQDSPMFESLPEHGVSEPATMGERLAWVLLLCHAKTKGRGGRVSVRKNAFARDYKLSIRAVEGMLSRAQKCAAIEVNGDSIFLRNWRQYQDKAFRSKALGFPQSGKTQETSENSATVVLGDGCMVMGDGSPSIAGRTSKTKSLCSEQEVSSPDVSACDACSDKTQPVAYLRAMQLLVDESCVAHNCRARACNFLKLIDKPDAFLRRVIAQAGEQGLVAARKGKYVYGALKRESSQRASRNGKAGAH